MLKHNGFFKGKYIIYVFVSPCFTGLDELSLFPGFSPKLLVYLAGLYVATALLKFFRLQSWHGWGLKT